MKKILCLALTALMLLSCACAAQSEPEAPVAEEIIVEEISETVAAEEAPAAEPATEAEAPAEAETAAPAEPDEGDEYVLMENE